MRFKWRLCIPVLNTQSVFFIFLFILQIYFCTPCFFCLPKEEEKNHLLFSCICVTNANLLRVVVRFHTHIWREKKETENKSNCGSKHLKRTIFGVSRFLFRFILFISSFEHRNTFFVFIKKNSSKSTHSRLIFFSKITNIVFKMHHSLFHSISLSMFCCYFD